MKISNLTVAHIKTKALFSALALIMISALAFSPLAYAVAPEANSGIANVNGTTEEWTLGTSSPDFFANMYLSGQDPDKPVLGYLYLRYDMGTNTLYMLVLTADGSQTMQIDSYGSETYVKIDNIKIVHSGSPTFSWVNAGTTYANGFEASFTLLPGIYQLYVHTNVYAYGELQTSSTLKAGIQLFVVPETIVGTTILSMFAALAIFGTLKCRNHKK